MSMMQSYVQPATHFSGCSSELPVLYCLSAFHSAELSTFKVQLLLLFPHLIGEGMCCSMTSQSTTCQLSCINRQQHMSFTFCQLLLDHMDHSHHLTSSQKASCQLMDLQPQARLSFQPANGSMQMDQDILLWTVAIARHF